MAEEKDTNFKITDRRKFNPDGTPREQVEEPEKAQIKSAEASSQMHVEPAGQPGAEGVRDNVVSFPGESAREKKMPESQAPAVEMPDPGAASAQQDAGASARAEQAKAAASAAEQAYNQMRGGGSPQMPEATFLALVDMLASEAAMCLGMIKHPASAEMHVDLDSARHLVDMLGILQQKTRGNLSAEESDTLENILAYLRMQFVSLSRKA